MTCKCLRPDTSHRQSGDPRASYYFLKGVPFTKIKIALVPCYQIVICDKLVKNYKTYSKV